MDWKESYRNQIADRLVEWVALREEIADTEAPFRAQIMELERAREAAVETLEEAAAEQAERITELTKVLGESVGVPGARTKFRRGYWRTTWDGKKLDGYAVAHPEILEFRKATEVGPSVRLELWES